MAGFVVTSIDPAVDPAGAALAALGPKIQRDLAIDPVTGDLEIPVRLLSGADSVLQRVWIRLRWFLGEWFLDQRLGVPWRERILIKGVDVRDVKQILARVVEQTPGVASVVDFDCTIDRRTRRLTIPKMTIVLDDGSTIQAKQKAPFIV
jgi:hypothetical protein